MIKDNKYNYLAKNTLLFTISSFGSKLMTFLLVPLYTNILSTTDYGVVDIISTTAMLLIYVLTLNISISVMRFAIEDKETPERAMRYGLTVLRNGTAIMGVGTLIVWKLALINWPWYYFVFIFSLFFVDALEGMLSNYLRATDRVHIMVKSSLLSTATKLVSNIVTLVFLRWGVIGYLFSMILGPMIASVYSAFYILPLKKIIIYPEEEKKLHKEMRRYAIPASMNALGWWVANSIDRYFITWMKGASLNGVYSVAYKIPTIMSTLCNIFGQAWGLSAIKEYDRDDTDGFFSKTYALLSAGLTFSCSVLILGNAAIARVLFARDFFEAWKYSSILVLSMLYSGLSNFLGGIFGAAKHNDELAASSVVCAVINMALNAILIPSFGGVGAAIATAVSFYVMWLMRYILSKRYLRFRAGLVRDHAAYVLIIIQIVLDHLAGHCYTGQVVIVALITLLYIKELQNCLHKSVEFIKRRRTK